MVLLTTDDKLAIMNWDTPWEPGIIISESSPFGQDDKQQLIWGLPDPLWTAPIIVAGRRRGLLAIMEGGS